MTVSLTGGVNYAINAVNADGDKEVVNFVLNTDDTKYYTVTIDGDLKEYVVAGGSATLLNALTGTGTGFVHKMGAATEANAAYGAAQKGGVNGEVVVKTA